MADETERINELETQLASLKGTYDSDKATWESEMGKKDAEIVKLQKYIADHLTNPEPAKQTGTKTLAERYAETIKELSKK